MVDMDFDNCLLAWCMLRKDFRGFRLDRILSLVATEESFYQHRVALLRDHLNPIRAETDASAKVRNPLD
jgi:predicted DNA-binding transcriptional regulator YafY